MILYHAISTYQILEVALHRMKYHRGERAVLILPDFIVGKHKDYFNIVQLGIFDEVYLLPYLQIPHDKNYLGHNLEEICRHYIPYSMNEFREIYVAGVHFFFSLLLIKKKIDFIAFEDAAGMVGKGEKIYSELREKFPQHAEIAKENGLFGFENLFIKEIIVQKQNIRVNKKQQIFDIRHELEEIESKNLEKIMSFFHVNINGGITQDKILLLTERYSVIGTMSETTQIDLYKFLVQRYLCEEKLIIKPHPDERIPYAEIFPKAIVLPATFPSELIPKIFRNGLKSICTFNSTAVNVLEKQYSIRHFSLEQIMEEKNESYRSNTSEI